MPHQYNSIFFDLDHTLFDFDRNSKEALFHCYRTLSFHTQFPSFDSFYQIYHQKNEELWSLYRKGIISKSFLSYERFSYPLRVVGCQESALSQAFETTYIRQIGRQSHLIPYAKEVLEYLYPKYNLYILSNGFRELQFDKIKSCNIDSYFKKVILSEDIGIQKPHPEIFEYALMTTGSKKETSIMIGDNLDADILGAFDFGIDQIYFNPQSVPLNLFSPTFQIQTLKEIYNIL